MSQATVTDERKRRQSVDEMLKHLNSNNLCVLPSSLVRILLDDNMTLIAESNEINRNIATSLEILANNLPSSENTNAFNDVISTKLDSLIAAVSASNAAMVAPPAQQSIEKEIKERATLFEKRLHSEQLCQLYEELLADVVPFAPNKLRVHVSPTAKETEKKHKRDATIFNVQTQVKIMQDNIKEWTERISVIDDDLETFLSLHEEKREGTHRHIHVDEEKAKKNVIEGSILKLRHTYDREKQADPTADFLLTISNQQQNPKNTWGQNKGRGGRHQGKGKNNPP